MPVKPIRPIDLAEQLSKTVPDGVVEAWNEIIAEKFLGGVSTFTVNELTSRICENMMCDTQTVLKKGWLNLEPLFEKAGWSVEYDKPGFDESYAAKFIFTHSRK
jgi:hypothetical protein